jgi:gliding motility-associated-like protein
LPAVQTWPAATISIDNTSTPAGAWTYLWQFGDGNISSVAEPNSHTYASWGTYTVQLTVSSPYCADSASNSIEIIAPAAIAFFEVNAAGCAPLSVEFVNQSQFATSYLWSFGDSSYSNLEHPEHTYFEAGSFYVQLVATGPGGQDVYGGGTISVYEVPTAMFTVSPTVVFLPDQPIHCTNNALNGNSFYWDFGDGSTSTEENPNHYYNQEGEFTIMLIANTIHNCKDTFTVYRAVVAEASGEIDFPSAFTPNPNGPNGGTYQQGDVNNDVFHPVFVGIEEYNLTIFNRWGEMIFESKDPNIGWDGYYRGEMCKQDVYVWKAKGKFLDGQSFFQAGDVTLLR